MPSIPSKSDADADADVDAVEFEAAAVDSDLVPPPVVVLEAPALEVLVRPEVPSRSWNTRPIVTTIAFTIVVVTIVKCQVVRKGERCGVPNKHGEEQFAETIFATTGGQSTYIQRQRPEH